MGVVFLGVGGQFWVLNASLLLPLHHPSGISVPHYSPRDAPGAQCPAVVCVGGCVGRWVCVSTPLPRFAERRWEADAAGISGGLQGRPLHRASPLPLRWARIVPGPSGGESCVEGCGVSIPLTQSYPHFGFPSVLSIRAWAVPQGSGDGMFPPIPMGFSRCIPIPQHIPRLCSAIKQ